MSRYLSILLTVAIVIGVTAGMCACSPKAPDAAAPTVSEQSQATPAETAAPSTKVTVAEPATAEASDVPAAPTAAPAADTAANEVIALVEGKEILRSELENALNGLRQRKAMEAMMSGKPGGGLTADDQMKALNHIIDGKVLRAVALKANTQVSDEEVNKEVESIKQRMGGDEVVRTVLQERGMTLEDMPKVVREDMILQKFIEEQSKDIAVTEADLQAAYDELKGKGAITERPETMDVSHILVKVDKSADEATKTAAKTKIDEAYKRVTEGKEDFGAVAKEVTDDPGSKDNGGLYEGVEHTQMTKEFDETMWKTPVNEVSQPFSTEYGWHILKPVAKHAAGVPTLDDLKSKIEGYVKNTKVSDKLEKMAAEARTGMKIEIRFEPKDEPAPAVPAMPAGMMPPGMTPPPAAAQGTDAAAPVVADPAEAPTADAAPEGTAHH